MRNILFFLMSFALGSSGFPALAHAQGTELPRYLRDRGDGVSTSLFGTFISKGKLIICPLFEHVADHNREYQPAKLGFALNEDFRGNYRHSKEQVFVAYGLSDRIALEFEGAFIKAAFEKSPADSSATPARIDESGFGDFEGQLRYCFLKENVHRPELYAYLQATARSQSNKVLIGDQDWDFQPGVGVIRGFSWGTMMFRTTVEYTRDDRSFNLGETALEYLKQLAPSWHMLIGIEGGEGGGPDEWELITGVRFEVLDFVSLKIDNSVGMFLKAPDWSPQIGLVFTR